MKHLLFISLVIGGVLALLGTAPRTQPTPYAWNLPTGFPTPVVPEDNPMSAAKVALGRHLFYETRLSGNATQACSSCHEQAKAFSDGKAVAMGSTQEAHLRNAQGLANAAYNPTLTWANPGLTGLERQVLVPLFGEAPVELGLAGKEELALGALAKDELYRQLFRAAFPSEADPFTVGNTAKALASFVRTIISGGSPYDRFVYAQDRDALSASAVRGMTLFFSEQTECHHCHGGFNFSDSAVHENTRFAETPFHNTGLYNLDGQGAYPKGNRGLFEITGEPGDMGKFRAPSLRNVGVTAPYFHDGSARTLDDLIDHNGDRMGKTSHLSTQERASLVAFLRTL